MRALCCICADLFVNNETNIAATPCGHVFHEHCLARWLMASSTCPSCRKNVIQGSVIPKLFFDIAEEDTDEVNPEKVTNELQSLKTQVAELKQKTSKHKTIEKDLKDRLKKREEELGNISTLLRREQDTGAAQQRMLQHFEAQQQVHKEERAEYLRTQRKLTELKHVETLVSGGVKNSEEILQQYSSGDKNSLQQLAKYAGILKREYEQSKVEKRTLKEQLDRQRKSSYSASRELADLKAEYKGLQEQLTRSEDDLKQAEKTNATLKAKVTKLQYSRKHPAESAGSFLETPKRQDQSDNLFLETPKLLVGKDFVTPKMTRPSGSGLIDLNYDSPLNQSFDLFEESPQTQMRKSCEENNMKVVKISSASTNGKAPKRVKVDADEAGDSFPLSTLNIMKKREKTGQLLSKTVIRQDYNGLGGTSTFTQPLGPPKFGVPKITSKSSKRTKFGSKFSNPALPTLDGFIDLS
ncbi:E3 ubiquitin-protein ligase TRAIP-like [Littorina saxatilis]|uniref:RING-type domain-containing protein n=1 Tax=Littorina saxatilis TaxID=31220 RepID=A0AAN9G3N2_9CAEN